MRRLRNELRGDVVTCTGAAWPAKCVAEQYAGRVVSQKTNARDFRHGRRHARDVWRDYGHASCCCAFSRVSLAADATIARRDLPAAFLSPSAVSHSSKSARVAPYLDN